jgi:hypothetical protein
MRWRDQSDAEKGLKRECQTALMAVAQSALIMGLNTPGVYGQQSGVVCGAVCTAAEMTESYGNMGGNYIPVKS